MGAELSTIANDLSCIECRKKRSPHAPVLVQPPRFPGVMPSPASAIAETARRDSASFASSLPRHKESSSAAVATVAAVFGEPPTRTKLAAALYDDDDSDAYAHAPAATARATAGSWRASAAPAPAASAPTADATTGITIAKRTSDDEYYYSDYEYEVERRAKEKKAAVADDEVRSEAAYYSDYYTDEDEPKQPTRISSTPTRA